MLTGAAALLATHEAYVAAAAPFCSWNLYNGGADPRGGTTSTLASKFIEHAESGGLGHRTPAERLMKFLHTFNPSILLSRVRVSFLRVFAPWRLCVRLFNLASPVCRKAAT
jgi:hypothetical protein